METPEGSPLPRLDLNWVDRAIGYPIGCDPRVTELAHSDDDDRRTLEWIVVEALSHPPCGVAFSGGRDSSALLALAASLARQHQLPMPLAFTNTYADVRTDETQWRRAVLDHLSLEAVEVNVRNEHLTVGAPAERMYRTNGLQFPANAVTHMTLAELVRGGTLLTGAGGDEVFGGRADPFFRWFRHKRPNPKDLVSLGQSKLPGAARRVGLELLDGHHWILPSVRSDLAKELGADHLTYPGRYSAALRRWVRDRYYIAIRQSLDAASAVAGASIVAPFFDRRFMAAWASRNGAAGPANRTAAMESLFGDLLPVSILTRTSKAEFSAAFHQIDGRFLAEWDGEGVPLELVDVEALRREWSLPTPHFSTSLMLQDAYFTWKGADS
jgi:asparagine synthetase B (glutamine-hydrolysing)